MAISPGGNLPRRFLPEFLLLTLDSVSSSHGYELCESVGSKGLAVDLAAVYRALRTLEQRDLVSSDWEPSESGPDRRVYSLTAAGRAASIAAATELATIRDTLALALESFSADTSIS